MYLPVMIEISGSEDCIDVICAVKYSQSCFANCYFMWQLVVLFILQHTEDSKSTHVGYPVDVIRIIKGYKDVVITDAQRNLFFPFVLAQARKTKI